MRVVWSMVDVKIVSISNKAMASFVMLSFVVFSFAIPYVFVYGLCLDVCLYMLTLFPMTPLLSPLSRCNSTLWLWLWSSGVGKNRSNLLNTSELQGVSFNTVTPLNSVFYGFSN